MNPSELNDIPSVRLASGVEMQQRWPSTPVQSEQLQKNGEAPRLIELAPSRGSQGTVITVVIQSLPHQRVPVKLAFNSLVVDTKQMQAQGITSLVAAVPPFQQTHSASANVPICICMLDKDLVSETWPVAEFIYEFHDQKEKVTFTTTPTMTSSTTANSSSAESSIDYPSADKPAASQPRGVENFLGGTSTPYDSFYQASYGQQISQYPYPYNNTANTAYGDNKYNAYRSNNTADRAQQPVVGYGSNNAMNLFNSNETGFTGMLNGFDQNESTTSTSAAPALPISQAQMNYAPQPTVSNVITTVAQRQNSAYGYGKASAHVPSTSVANYQPYPGLVSRANLKIMGDLDSMAKNWAPEEWEHRRRLVQFWREQTGNEIRCTFDPVAQGERITANSGQIVVSCIYWIERNDCFITSVDCIHLLESLMDIRFSVEEKNRVRRNLEGFRPLTVSKCKAESADFFKLIMSFPNPKPRNIEKDVKVFPWKTLPYALKKIVTKYTASSYNASGTQQRRAQMTKGVNASPPATPPPTKNNFMPQQDTNQMNNFYQQTPIYQPSPQQFNAYQNSTPTQANEQLPFTASMYHPSSIPAYSNTPTSYSQPQSPSVVQRQSPARLQYPFNDIIHSTDPNTPEASVSTPSSRRQSLDNQADCILNLKNE